MNLSSSLINLTWVILFLVSSLVGICTLAGFLGRLWWRLDLFSHFRVQYFILLTISSIFFLLGGKTVGAIASGVFALINAFQLFPLYLSPRSSSLENSTTSTRIDPPEPSSTYRVLLANVLQKNQQYKKVIHLIQTAGPNIVVLIEVNQHWIDGLQPILAGYAHFHYSLRVDNYGIAIYSQFPLISAETLYFGEAGVPSIVAHINLHGIPLTLIGTHPPPPKSRTEALYRDQQLDAIAAYLVTQPGCRMILGDLNITPWSPYFKQLLRNGVLRDSQQGQGIQPSWPVDNPFLRVPIDHILVSPEIKVHKRLLGQRIGSDHLPVVMDFSLINTTYRI